MPNFGVYSLHPSKEYERLSFVVFELGGKRHVISRSLFEKKNWESLPRTLLMARAKHLAREVVGETHASDALAILRSVPDYAVFFETDGEEHEWEVLRDIADKLTSALAMEDAFNSAVAFSKSLKLSGFDDLFDAFRNRWRPAAVPTEAMLLQAAREMEESFEEGFPDAYTAELETLRAPNDIPPQEVPLSHFR